MNYSNISLKRKIFQVLQEDHQSHQLIHSSIYPSTSLSIHQFIYISAYHHSSIYPSSSLSIYITAYPYICLSIHLPFHPSCLGEAHEVHSCSIRNPGSIQERLFTPRERNEDVGVCSTLAITVQSSRIFRLFFLHVLSSYVLLRMVFKLLIKTIIIITCQ